MPSAPTTQPSATATFRTDDGLQLTFDRWVPSGPTRGVPVLLHHGFAASAAANWVAPGIVDALLADNRNVIALDARGHGRAEKPHDSTKYGHARMSTDVSTLLDHLGFATPGSVDLIGYSMGGFVTAITAARREPRLRCVVIGGIGERSMKGEGLNRDAVAAALEADDASTVADRSARQFRNFAETTGADRLALAAIMRSPFQLLTDLDRINVPALVLVGTHDDLATHPERLAEAIPGAVLELTPGTHLSAVAEPQYAQAMVTFLHKIDAVG